MKKPILDLWLATKVYQTLKKSQNLQKNTPYKHQRENFGKLLVLFPE